MPSAPGLIHPFREHGGEADAREALRPLLMIVVIGAALRLGVMAFGTGAVDTEGAEYARIAENLVAGRGYRGIVTPGVELMFPPLYPLLIAALSFVTRDFELAARLVCVLFGSLLPVAMFLLASTMYSRRTSLWIAAVGALHPLLISISAWTYSECSYMTVVLLGLYLTIRCMQGAGTAHFVFAGIVLACAYLIRPEGFILPFLAAVFVTATRWRTMAVTVPRVALLLATFAVIATPYIAFVSRHTGQLRFEGKTPINFEMARRVLAGEDYLDVIYGLGPNLVEQGVYMRPNEEVIRTATMSFADLRRIVWRARTNFTLLIQMLSRAPFGSPLLLILALLGLFARPWPRGTRAAHLLVITVLAVTAASLLTNIFAENSRYFWIYVPILLMWAVTGAAYLGQWVTATLDAGRARTGTTQRMGVAVGIACVVAMLSVSALTVDDPIGGRQSRPTKEAGLWLRGLGTARATVMDTQTNLAFHAGADFVYVPNVSADQILAYADAKHVDFIVVRPKHPWVAGRSVLEDWGEHGLDHPRARLIYTARGGAPAEDLFIYEWTRRPRQETAGVHN